MKVEFQMTRIQLRTTNVLAVTSPQKIIIVLLSIIAGVLCDPAYALDYPVRPVKLLVPYPPGGLPDVVGRVLAVRLAEKLGQQFVVDNKPSAGGILATQLAARAPADGYTLLVADGAQLEINPYLFARLPYDPVKDLAPISLVAFSPLFFVSRAGSGLSTLRELIAFARANPGQLSYGSPGIGSVHHLAMESLKSILGLDIVHVPYKGTGQSVPAFIAGEVQIIVSARPAIAQYAAEHQAQLLAVSSHERDPAAPDIPSVAEIVPDYDFRAEIGILAPAGTPASIIERLSAHISEALRNPDTRSRLEAVGAQAVGSTPHEFAEHISSNLKRYATAVKVSGAKAD